MTMELSGEAALLRNEEEGLQQPTSSGGAQQNPGRARPFALLVVAAIVAVVMLVPRGVAHGAAQPALVGDGREPVGLSLAKTDASSAAAEEDQKVARGKSGAAGREPHEKKEDDLDDNGASEEKGDEEEKKQEKEDSEEDSEEDAKKTSSDDDEDAEEDAPAPCKTAHVDDTPSLFCWAVMFEDDKALIKSTFEGRAGIFACNDYAVISTEEMLIGKDDCGAEVNTLQTKFPEVKKGMYGVDGSMTSSWLNVPIFTICWDLLIENGKVWERDFTVKVDPDTVFFPGRLGYQLKDHVGEPMYTTDCRYWGGDPVGKVFGSLEVVSKQAIGTWKEDKDACTNLPSQGWGEDYWLQHCMTALNVESVILADFVTDNTCPEGGGGDCGDAKFVALHPFKDAGAWWECWKQSNPEE